MAFVCSATWTAKPGRIQTVLDALSELAPASREEPGCIYYQPYQDPETPDVVRIFEVYDDRAAFDAHGASDHFQRLALGVAIPELENRERDFYETVEV